MLLGGTVTGNFTSPQEWEHLLTASRFKASAYRYFTDHRTVILIQQIIMDHF